MPLGIAGHNRSVIRHRVAIGFGFTAFRCLTAMTSGDLVHAFEVDAKPAVAAVGVLGALHTLPRCPLAVTRAALEVQGTLQAELLRLPAASRHRAEPAAAAAALAVALDARVFAAHD